MFDNLTSKLQDAFKSLSGQSTLTESNISEALNQIRRALLEADVALPVVREFVEEVKEKAIGRKVNRGLNPEQEFVSFVNEALTNAMGSKNVELNLRTQPPAVILMAGLQGAGKTTSAAKLAKLLKSQKKKVLLVSADVYRPAAIQQLQTLALDVDVDFYPSSTEQNPVDIVSAAKEAARKGFYDVLIVDTAGRLHVDETMMEEIKAIHSTVNPIETLFVVDAMTGQDAANTAKAFSQTLPLTGVIMTKLDGDVRGGAALSVHKISGAPIKFVGMGEKTDALELFHPDRIAGRILDMGDMLTLIEKLKAQVDEEQTKKLEKKMKKGSLNLEDFLEQLKVAQNMGGVGSLMGMLPGMNQIKDKIDNDKVENQIKRTQAIIQSMTPKERQNPDILKSSRKIRIANGSGTSVQEINALLKQFEQMQKVQKMMANMGMSGMMRMLGGAGGGALNSMVNLFGGNKRK